MEKLLKEWLIYRIDSERPLLVFICDEQGKAFSVLKELREFDMFKYELRKRITIKIDV